MKDKSKVGFWGFTGLILSGLLLGLLLGTSVCYLLGPEDEGEGGVSGETSVTREGANIPKDNMIEDGIMGENIALELPSILADSIDETETADGFVALLESKNITVIGSVENKVTSGQIEGFLKDIDEKYSGVIDKYEKLIEENPDGLELEPIELLELDFYSLSEADKECFLTNAENQEITVQMDANGTILISYNPNS